MPLWGRAAASPSNNVACAETYLPTKWHLDPSGRLATTDMDLKLKAVPLSGGEAGSPFNTISPGPRPSSLPSGIVIHPAVFATTDMGRKLGAAAVPLLGELYYVVLSCSRIACFSLTSFAH